VLHVLYWIDLPTSSKSSPSWTILLFPLTKVKLNAITAWSYVQQNIMGVFPLSTRSLGLLRITRSAYIAWSIPMKDFMPYREKVNAYFQSLSSHWNNVYASKSVYAETIRARHIAVLDWIDGLAFAPGSQALEIGCGAGFTSIALAERGFGVQAVDISEAMVQQARQNAAERGVAHLLTVEVGDVYSLAFEGGSFDLVIAIGVFPWLAETELALQEMARVTKPGGYILLTAANRRGLPYLLDPQLNPVLVPLRQRVKTVLGWLGFRVGLPEQLPKMVYHSRRCMDEALMGAGLLKTKDKTLGFGPFTLFCRTVLPNRLGVMLHQRLQRLADRNVPLVRSVGMSYHVLARKVTLQ
jgi:ubiquinone/menaquinone biosynthesis C-methylase UbiE